MSNFSNKIIIKYIFLFTTIYFVKGKINKENELIKVPNINEGILKYLNVNLEKSEINNQNKITKKKEHCYLMNDNNKLYLNEEKFLNLTLGQNLIKLNNSDINLKLDLNYIVVPQKDLLLYTNLTNNLKYNFQNKEENVSKFYLIPYNNLLNNQIIEFKLIANNEPVQGFLNFKLVNKDEFELNYNTIREIFYDNRSIVLNKKVEERKYFINFIPTDNNSDLYYLQYSFDSSLKGDEKNKVKLYYLNKLDNDTIDGIFEHSLKDKQIKRDRKINGKIEILLVEYKNLNDNNKLKLKYNRIKGEGILGFILTQSILFALLILTIVIFLKNTYYGNSKSDD